MCKPYQIYSILCCLLFPIYTQAEDVKDEKKHQDNKEALTEENKEDNKKEVMVVKAKFNSNPIASQPELITSEEIRTGTMGNGNITDILKTLPSIQVSNSSNNGNQQGEIKPSKVTIHGASSYQNNFMLDGISFNNDIDPSNPNDDITATRINSDEQGLYIDSRLIDNVKVYDKNIPVEYGGFTGGVIDVTGRRWKYTTGGSVYYNTTRSAWNKIHTDKRVDFSPTQNTSNRPNRFQPHYKKENFGGWFESGITDNLGFVFSASRKESDISSYAYRGEAIILDSSNKIAAIDAAGGYKDQTRTSNNYLSKFSWYMTDNTYLDWSVNYSNYQDYSFSANVANSGFKTNHTGIGSSLQLTSQQDLGELELTTGYQVLEDKRKDDQKYYVSYRYENWMEPDENFEKQSGGIGDLKTKQKNTELKGKFTFTPINWGNTIHQPKSGFEFKKTNASYIRNKDFFRYNFVNYNDVWKNWMINAFKKGTYSADYKNYALYADDTITYHRLTLQPGIRVDYDNFVKNYNVAPRIATTYDLFGTKQTNLIAGYNRYYGRTMMGYALYGAQNGGLYNCNHDKCKPGDVIGDNWTNKTDFEGLNHLSTPYSDEINFGIEQKILDTLWKFEYVHRNSRDEVVSKPKYARSSVRTFDNTGKSEHNSFAISVTNPEKWKIATTENTLKASIIWEKNQSNTPKVGYAHYDAAGRRINKDYVYYNGKVIKASKLPATDFNLPLRFNLELTTAFPDYDLSIYNQFQWHAQRSQAVRYESSYKWDPDKGQLARYDREDFGSTFRWDVKMLWKPSFAYGANMSLEVNNLLNKRNVTDRYNYGVDANGNPIILNSYDIGRQFWMQIGYDF